MHVGHAHPKGLYVLFATEAWERFSYYGMRALLVLYLTQHLEYPREEALSVYATYTGLVYLTPILGGMIADRYIGARSAVMVGGAVMALGHLAMAFEPLLYPALGMLIVGNGFFKPNISTIVGGLYEENDPRRDGGFTIFYMGINLGAFFSPLVCGTLGEKVGWHYGFSAAGIGMVVGLATFMAFQRLLGTTGFAPDVVGATAETGFRAKDWRNVVVLTLVSCALVFGILEVWTLVGPWVSSLDLWLRVALGIFFIALSVFGPLLAGSSDAPKEPFTGEAWQRIVVILVLGVFVIFFWMGFEQSGGTMTLFAAEQTDRHLFGWEIPASYFQSINPLAIVLLAPMFSVLWFKLDSGRFRTATPTKMALGMIILGLGFALLWLGQRTAEGSPTGQVGPLWLAAVYLIHTIGELCLSPIGLSMVTKLSPMRIVSLMMGFWFGFTALANYLAGMLESIVEQWGVSVYATLIATSIGAGVLLLAITPLLKRWMHGRG
ncbi:MAG: peptide MFS transporter [Myxococcales bacterium]|nr:peptide MFS transporter [Myxococcales bacterium]